MSRHETRNARNLRLSKERLVKAKGRRSTFNLGAQSVEAIRVLRANGLAANNTDAVEYALKVAVAMPLPEIATALRCAAYNAYSLTLSPSSPPEAFKWFKSVEPGQLVLETSTIFHRHRDCHGIGWLLKTTQEPFPGDWDNEPPPLETCWYLKCFDGVVYRWTNASFVRVPDSVNPWMNR
jgi:hypothetical protein